MLFLFTHVYLNQFPVISVNYVYISCILFLKNRQTFERHTYCIIHDLTNLVLTFDYVMLKHVPDYYVHL